MWFICISWSPTTCSFITRAVKHDHLVSDVAHRATLDWTGVMGGYNTPENTVKDTQTGGRSSKYVVKQRFEYCMTLQFGYQGEQLLRTVIFTIIFSLIKL